MRKYNVSNIERLTYEMLVDIIGAIFKAKAHNAYYSPIYGYWEWAQDRWLIQIKDEASKLKRFAEIEEKLGIKHTAYSFGNMESIRICCWGGRGRTGEIIKCNG